MLARIEEAVSPNGERRRGIVQWHLSCQDTLYFAYGSNLSIRQMRRRCPGSEVVGRARLPDYRLGFTRYATKRKGGVADIVPEPGAEVWGALYTVDDDRDGGARRVRGRAARVSPHGRERVLDDEGAELVAVAYYANKTGRVRARDASTWASSSPAHATTSLPDEYIQALERHSHACVIALTTGSLVA